MTEKDISTDEIKNASPIRQFRIEKGLTQKELAEKARVSQQRVSELENGVKKYNNLYAFVAIRLADALGVHPRELLYEEKKP